MRSTTGSFVLGSLVVAAAVALSAAACSSSTSTDTSSEGGSGGSTTTTNSGGQGGTTSTCPVDCSQVDTGNPCQVAVCNEATGQCRVQAGNEGQACDDNLFCTVGETCAGGLCTGGATNDCGTASDPCKSVTCDEASKSCSSIPANEGIACTVDDLCLINTTCKNGLCTGAAKDCFFAPVGECGVATCNPANGKCEGMADPAKNGQPCFQSGDKCMVNKVCNAGNCEGGIPKDCTVFTNGCNNGLCDPVDGQCYAEAIPEGGACLEATDDCNIGICDNMGQCLPQAANEGAGCNDGNACTLGETCAAGVCQGGSMAGYEVYFTETFASNAAGWTTDTEWQIGPAVAGSCPTGTGDPGADHTPTMDNGIAGVVIGGCASTGLHPFYYLTSPVIDTSAAPGPVWLELWRMLNSDYTPYMQNTIDVFNGTSWVNVWQTGPSPGVMDADWTHVSYDITAHKNAAMQVRFGFMIGSSGVFTIGSWNVDDVVVANAVCN